MNDIKILKIALVTTTLSSGGAERCAAMLSTYFFNQNVDVHHIVLSGKIEYNYSGKLFHLIDNQKNNSAIARFFRLKKYLKQHNFNFIIDFRTKEKYLQEIIINRLLYKESIQTIHSSKTDSYLPKSVFFEHLLYPKKTIFISVCHAINNAVLKKYLLPNCHTIYNPIDFTFITKKLDNQEIIDYKFIVAAGSMNKNIKQFDVLIDCYAKSNLPQKNIKLVILGDGFLKPNFIKLAQKLNLSDKIIFTGNVANPFIYYAAAYFFVLCSKYEGFPMVVLEALACNTPVVAYDCATGPNEIITDRENGLLVENQNQEKLIEAMNVMIDYDDLYQNCKKNAKNSVTKFDINIIGKQWMDLFENKI